MKDHGKFFREFLKNPAQIGSVIPSSRFLERRIMKAANLKEAKTVVELGPGTGGITRKILKAMPENANLVSIELNSRLYGIVSKIHDNRLLTHHGNAEEINEILGHHKLGKADAVISGIPFSTMPHEVGINIIKAISRALSDDGRFVAYQLRGKVASLSNPLLGRVRPELEIFNIPPMRVWRWDKT